MITIRPVAVVLCIGAPPARIDDLATPAADILSRGV